VRIRRKWRWLLAGGLFGVLLLGAAVLLPQSHPIDRATVDRIRPGVTRREVEELLGSRGYANTRPPAPGQTMAAWFGSEGSCVIVFDAGDRVVSTRHQVMNKSAAVRAWYRVRLRAEEWAGAW
jgi:hypothetical protein